MLERLDKVPWHLLQHAYGPASDVPDLIRDLYSSNASERANAIHELYGNIWHQGTIYEATSYAVPFLIELVAARTTPDRDSILSLLGTLAKSEVEHRWVEPTRAAVHAGQNLYLSCLREADHLTSAASAYVLTRFPEDVEEVLPSLIARYDDAGSDGNLRTGLIVLARQFSADSPDAHRWMMTFRGRVLAGTSCERC